MSAFMLRSRPFLLVIACLLVALAGEPGARGQDKFPGGRGKGRFKGKGNAATTTELKKYDDVITKDGKTFPGVFVVHRIDDKVYFEIPKDGFGQLMLWQARSPRGRPASAGAASRSATASSAGTAAATRSTSGRSPSPSAPTARPSSAPSIRPTWTRSSAASPSRPRARTAPPSSTSPPLFTERRRRPLRQAGRRRRRQRSTNRAPTSTRSRRSRPTSKSARCSPSAAAAAAAFGRAAEHGRGGGGGGRSYTAVVHYSLVMLPEKPMMGRFFDPRVGYFTRVVRGLRAAARPGWIKRQYITRFRLEKKDPTAEVSEPVKPIVFYLSREVPEKWRPYLKKGVEDWKPAFEKAGFKNAIICKDAPERAAGPELGPRRRPLLRHPLGGRSDRRTRWARTSTTRAPARSSRRTSSSGTTSSSSSRCGTSCSAPPVDPRGRKLPLPDDLTGELLRYVCCHEVGHTLGLRHNHRASSAYTIEQLRDPEVHRQARQRRLDHVLWPVQLRRPARGQGQAADPGHRRRTTTSPSSGATGRSPGAKSPEDEARDARQVGRRGRSKSRGCASAARTARRRSIRPCKTENIGNDALEATALGLKNLDRVARPAGAGDDRAWARTSRCWRTRTRRSSGTARTGSARCAKQVGGVVENRTLGGRGSESFTRVPEEQAEEGGQVPARARLHDADEAAQPGDRQPLQVRGRRRRRSSSQQKALLYSLLSGRRFRLLMDAEVVNLRRRTPRMQFLNDVQDGVWSELRMEQPVVDTVRRSLQRDYLDHLKSELSTKQAAPQTTFPTPRRRPGGATPLATGTKGTDFRARRPAVLADPGQPARERAGPPRATARRASRMP